MPSVRTRRIVGLLVGLIGALTIASSASAAIIVTPQGAPKATPFGCRASVLRATLLNNITAEPYVANTKQTPCATGSSSVESASVPSTKNVAVSAGPVGAFTFDSFDPTFKTSPGATAVTSVEGVTIPTSTGNVYVAGPIQATATYECVNNALVSNYQSTLDLIYIGGVPHDVPNSKPTTISLGGGNYVAVNQVTKTDNSLTVDLVHVHIQNTADIVVGEAVVSEQYADPCANTKGSPPPLEICPTGTTLNAAKQFCYIKNCTGGIIKVSRPFHGPSGGTVLAVCAAKKKYTSPCLEGSGPAFVVVADKQGAHVLGTEKSDRIIATAPYVRVAGLGGNDCLDGKSHNDKLFDGNGKERVYANSYTRVAIGSGNSYIQGSAGHNTISTGNGNTTIVAKGGYNQINAGLGKKKIFASPGPDRIYTPSTTAKVSCGVGHNDRVFLRRAAMPYARAHGCKIIIHLQ